MNDKNKTQGMVIHGRFSAVPVVSSVMPVNGPQAGGTSVTISGSNFNNAIAVRFGTSAAASFTVISANQITAVSPAGNNVVDITVTTAGGTSIASAVDLFTYLLGKRKQGGSYLSDETWKMDRDQRETEQQGHRRLAKVHAREHREEQQNSSPEGELQNSISQHPSLNNQRFDGIDPNLNPEPPLNTDARREYDNEKREQEMEKQLRLGNMPQFTTAPKPQGPK